MLKTYLPPDQHSYFHWWRVIFYLGILCELFLLMGCTPPPKQTRREIFPNKVSSSPSSNLTMTDDLVLYLDTSIPMKGYVSSDGQTVFSKTLRTILDVATMVNKPVNVYLRTVDAKVGAPQPGQIIGSASINQSFYTGTETNLVAAIQEFSPIKVPITSENVTHSPSTARFHILITDGVQYTKDEHTNQDCLGGSNPICVRKKFIELLAEQGWAGSIIGMRSQFCCSFFSELNQKTIPYKTQNGATSSYRPFYLFIFSPDHEALSELVAQLKERLRRTVGEKDLVLRELGLTSAYAEKLTESQATNVDLKFEEAGQGAPKARRSDQTQPALFDLNLDVKDSPKPHPFTVTIPMNWTQSAKDGASEEELVKLLTWELEPVLGKQAKGGYRFADIRLVEGKSPVYEKGQFKVNLVASWPFAAGTPVWRAYRLVAKLNLEKASPSWVSEWSTDLDTTSKVGNKTLYLESTLLNLWRNPVLKKQAVVEIGFRIGPSN
jgi:hypothetical protein